MIKVLYITDQIYLHGGGERVLTNKSNYLVEKNEAEVYIVTSEQKGFLPCYSINSEVILKDLNINYNRSISYFNPTNFIKIPKHYFRLKKIINKIKPDVIVTLSTQFDFYFLPFIHKKIPKIKEFHSSRHYRSLKRNKNKSILKKMIYALNDYVESKYDYLAILTKDEQQYFKSKNTIIIPNSYTNYPIKVSNLDNKRVISAGRIAPVKQFDKLIEAWKIVSNKFPDWHLDIYGDGELDFVSKLKQQIIDLNLKKQVTIHNSTNKLEQKMLESSMYVMSSETECFPMVLLEAMSCGLPIVSFDCPNGPRNIIKHNIDGFLVEHNNTDALAERICFLINNHTKRKEMGAKARNNVNEFIQSNVMKMWLSIFERNKIN